MRVYNMKTKHIPKSRIFKNAGKVESLMSFLIMRGYKCKMTKTYFEPWFYSKGNIHYPASYYLTCSIDHPKVVAIWCSTNDDSYQNMSGYICIDKKELFNKWSQVQINISLDENFETILQYLKNTEHGLYDADLCSYNTIRNDFNMSQNRIL